MKRLLTIALVSALMTTSLVGCGSEDPASDNNEKQEQTTTVDEDESKDDESKDSEKEDSEKEESEDSEKEEKDLSAWAGDWNNMGSYLEKPEIQTAFDQLAEKEGTTAEEEKMKYVEKRRTDFNGMTVEGNTITLYDGFKSEDGKEIGSSEYKYIGEEKTMLDKHELTWDIYEAVGEDAPYKYFLMMPVHGDEGLKHFHFRYGDEDPKEILAKDNWFPTMVAPDSTDEQFIEEITE
ncbi:MAG: ZinT/AdcA family metal-binding protein [Andreesenia angusta]|nr:ZinT/AdcA family metal-binding protein [Andreesenia angusta]